MRYTNKTRKSSHATYTFEIDALSHEGRGIAQFSSVDGHPKEKIGKKAFIRYALPGEKVVAKITHETKRLEEGEMLELLSEPSTLRVPAICSYYKVCGGCSMQHIKEDQQILLKQDVLHSHLRHFANLKDVFSNIEWLAPLNSERQDYRRRTRISVRYLPAKKQFMMGFRSYQSQQLVTVQDCSVLDHQLNQALPALYNVLSSLDNKAQIGHIELAKGDEECSLVVRHLAPFAQQDHEKLLGFAQQQGWQLYYQPHADSSSLHRVDEPKAAMYLHYTLPDFSLKFAFSPQDFTQVNTQVNRKMVSLACELLELKAGERVLDLFAGLGNFTLALARCVDVSGYVVGVEGSHEMVQRGTENAIINKIPNVKFFSQDLTQDFSDQSWAKHGFDAILIDPPRSGAFEVMQYIRNFGASRIVYVSCNPATLARDASVLAEQGYRLKKAGVMDMFPHTGHVESIALFERYST